MFVKVNILLLIIKGANYPTAREGHTFTYIPSINKYYLFGGISSKRHNELFVYDARNILLLLSK